MSRRMIRPQPPSGGWLEVVCGPMFSGKSEELIRRLRRAEIAGQRALIVKPRLDHRYDTSPVFPPRGAPMRAVAIDEPADIPGLVDGYDVVGVDEVQFFPPEIILILDGLVESGMRIVACGLDQDFRGFPFGTMPELLCRAELVDKLQAVCHRCGGPAPMTERLRQSAPAGPAACWRRPPCRRRRDDRRGRVRAVRGALPELPRARGAGPRRRLTR